MPAAGTTGSFSASKAPEGDGNDTIFGGAGADEFVIAGHFGLDAIKDFGLEDHLVALDPVRGGGAEDFGDRGSGTAARPAPTRSGPFRRATRRSGKTQWRIRSVTDVLGEEGFSPRTPIGPL